MAGQEPAGEAEDGGAEARLQPELEPHVRVRRAVVGGAAGAMSGADRLGLRPLHEQRLPRRRAAQPRRRYRLARRPRTPEERAEVMYRIVIVVYV